MAWRDLFKRKKDFVVTEADRSWVEECYENLIKAFGYPLVPLEVDISEKYFPQCFATDSFSPENILLDLCRLLALDATQFSIVTVSDIRDSDLDYSTEGRMFEAELVLGNSNHVIHLAQSIVKRPKRLVYLLAKELCVYILTRDFSNYNREEDESLFAYIVAIWFGIGTIFANNLVDVGFERDGLKERDWFNYSVMPPPVFGYALAYMDKLTSKANYTLSGEVEKYYKLATDFLKDKTVALFDANELESNTLFAKSADAFDAKNFNDALVLAQKALFMTQDIFKKSDLNVSVGYAHLMLERYDVAIPYFEKAIELNEYNAYAYDNMGFCYINLGELEKGKSLIEKAMETKGNDNGYSFRNLGFYYWKKGDLKGADEYFNKAKNENIEVDLLDEIIKEFERQKN